jgi:hypothetical protein
VTRGAPAAARPASRPAFNRAAFLRQLASFVADRGEAQYAALSGRRNELGMEAVYRRHAALFGETAIDALRAQAAGSARDAREARALLAVAVEGNLATRVAELTDAIQAAQASAVIVWRGERIGYRAAPARIARTTDRAERNALQASYDEAVDAINPLREARFGTMRSAIEELGFGSEIGLMRELHGIDPDALAADMRQFLVESETVHFAALRRYLAEIGIEQGDASSADLTHLVRGNGWDAWFDPHRLMPVLAATAAGLEIDLGAQEGLTLDFEARPNKSGRAIAIPVRVPGDVRLLMQPRGGHHDYEAALHELGHAEHLAHVDPRLAAAWKYAGDASVGEAYAFLLQHLAMEPEWLSEQLGMTDGDLTGWLDFAAFRRLVALRRHAAKLLYEQRLHRDGDLVLARAYYAGMLGHLVGVRVPEAAYLADVDDHLYGARYLRGWMLESALATSLRDRHGVDWWRRPSAGETLRRSWSRGQEWNADALVAHLGYDRLDWRPVLRQIRTRLIGEMSGYGGPNITTRAGTRKV